MEYKTSQEKLNIVFDIITKLKNFETNTGLQNIYLPHFSYVSECTEIFNNYIKKNERFKGKILFKEINKYIEYDLPPNKRGQPLFVIRSNKIKMEA